MAFTRLSLNPFLERKRLEGHELFEVFGTHCVEGNRVAYDVAGYWA